MIIYIKYIFTILIILLSLNGYAQSKMMKNLAEKYPDTRAFVMYHSSFTMLNQTDNPEIAALAATIDKIKVLTFDRFSKEDKKELFANLEANDFETLMSIKHKGYDVITYIKEGNNEIEGYFLLLKTAGKTLAVDVLGSPDPKQIGKLIDTVINH